MEYRIDQIIECENNEKYMIIDQGIYKNKNYYLISKVLENETLSEKFTIVEESDGKIKTIKDGALLKALSKYFEERI